MILALVFLSSGCQDDNGKDDYSGVSDLIADRNKARYHQAERSSGKPDRPDTTPLEKETSSRLESEASRNEALSSIALYEEDVEIIGSASGRSLAKGVAYINKNGQIVRIKILKKE